MTNMHRVFLVLICAAFLLAADAQCTWACSCGFPSATPGEARDQRAAVFAGRVTDVSIPDPNSYTLFRSVAVTFDVSDVWKGDVGASIVIGTSREEASCGYTFVVGQEYLIYAFEYEGQLVTGICDRTRLLADAQDDLAALGEGRVPVAAPTPLMTATPSTTPRSEPLPLGVAPVVIVAGGWLLVSVLLVASTLRRPTAR